ncbi:MAG: polysaccharide deacetylase family protein [bacterium]
MTISNNTTRNKLIIKKIVLIINIFLLNLFNLFNTIDNKLAYISNSYNMSPTELYNTFNFKQNFKQFDSYIITTSYLDDSVIKSLNQFYDANFCNLDINNYYNQFDIANIERVILNLIQNYKVENLLLNINLNDNYTKINSDINIRNIEPIESLSHYLTNYPEFNNNISNSSANNNAQILQSVSNIKNICVQNNINLILISTPVYYQNFDYQSTIDLYRQLATITDFWDFSLSSISYDPRYFYDSNNFRDLLNDMMFRKITDSSSAYIPDDFGIYITNQNISTTENLFSNLINLYSSEEEITSLLSQSEVQIPILTYHHFDEIGGGSSVININNFKEQLKTLLENGFNSISFTQLIDYALNGVDLPENPFIITIDDGYSSNYELAFPILKDYNTKATIFIIGVSVGKDLYKDSDYSIIPHFNYEQAQEMIDSNLISIQPHTYDMHQWAPYEENIDRARTSVLPLSGESNEDYVQVFISDLVKITSDIEANTSEKVNAFSYPLGISSNLTETILKAYGIHSTVSTKSGVSTVVKGLPQSLLLLNRINMTDETDILSVLNSYLNN